MKLKTLTTFLICLICLSCNQDDLTGGGPGNGNPENQSDLLFQENFGASTTADFMGKVVNGIGQGIIDANVTIGNITVMTDVNGVFIINNANVFENFALIKVSKPNYLDGFKTLVPLTQSTNDVKIKLLKKRIIGTVNSGEASEVDHFGISKVSFSGDFVDSNGDPYNGQVEVALQYLSPNTEFTFETMPGMLFARDESDDATALETYGMLNINLYSPNGERLNISETSTATIEFPVDDNQMGIAPETINLWYFDEELGYWREEGFATKIGDKYVAEVSHFSWWNCDLPMDYVNACFTVQASGTNLTNYLIHIIRNTTGQQIYSGYTNYEGEECGLFPVNEQVTIRVFGNGECGNEVIYETSIGPISEGSNFNINIPSPNFNETSLMASVTNCDGLPMTNGYAVIYYGFNGGSVEDFPIVPITDGTLNYDLTYCDPEAYTIFLYDVDAQQFSDEMSISLTPNVTDLGVLQTCINPTGGTYHGIVNLRNQAEVEIFGAHAYTQVNGTLVIGNFSGEDNINDLSSLSTLTKVYVDPDNVVENASGRLRLFANNLTSLNGLQNITTLNGLSIRECFELVDLSGLEGLTAITGEDSYFKSLDIHTNFSLESLNGLNNLQSIGDPGDQYSYFRFARNPELQNLDALSNLTEVYGPISTMIQYSCGVTCDGIAGNEILDDFCGLQNLFATGVYQDVEFTLNAYNPTVQDIIDGNCSQ